MQSAAEVIQRCLSHFVLRRRVHKGLQRLARQKMLVRTIVTAWRTRRTLNCLCTEVQDFVNCEEPGLKARLRDKFHCLFQTVMDHRMYLEHKANQLQSFISETERRLVQKPVKSKPKSPAVDIRQARLNKSLSKSRLQEQVRESLEKVQKSCESVKSFKSIENTRVITELKQFLRKSSDKNPMHCDSSVSIQISTNQEVVRSIQKANNRAISRVLD
jgi:hypothetical protein